MPKVLITDPIDGSGIQKLEEFYDVDVETDLTQDELINTIHEYEALIVRSGTKVSEDVLKEAENLKIIGRAGVGVDNIDIDAATRYGVVVANAPEGNTVAAAEHTISLLFSLARNIPQANYSLKNGEWRKEDFVGVEVKGNVLGVFGLGRIGGEVAKRASSLGMKVIGYDPYISKDRAKEIGAKLVDKDELLKQSDFISVHVPLNKKTEGLIKEEELKNMKDNARIIHTSRGGVIDENDIAKAVEKSEIAGAAFDVFTEEPPKSNNPLLKVQDIIVTPHLGASTKEAQLNVSTTIADQVIEVLEGRSAETAINAPSIQTVDGEYVELSQVLGRLIAQMIDWTEEIEIEYSGEISDQDTSPLTVAVQEGFLSSVLEEPVNLVNAPSLMEERGVEIRESKTGRSENFVSLISVKAGDQEVAGTLFGEEPTVVKIGEYRVDAPLSKHILLVKNVDKPGMIGKVGTVLGKYDVNIAGMHNGREEIRGEAIMILNVDSSVPENAIDDIVQVEGIKEAKYISL